MFRTLVASLTLLGVLSAGDFSQAQPVSRQNPYRSFNISGVNYGSQRWERRHHGRSAWSHPKRSFQRWR